jgi:hypothetical protein
MLPGEIASLVVGLPILLGAVGWVVWAEPEFFRMMAWFCTPAILWAWYGFAALLAREPGTLWRKLRRLAWWAAGCSGSYFLWVVFCGRWAWPLVTLAFFWRLVEHYIAYLLVFGLGFMAGGSWIQYRQDRQREKKLGEAFSRR